MVVVLVVEVKKKKKTKKQKKKKQNKEASNIAINGMNWPFVSDLEANLSVLN